MTKGFWRNWHLRTQICLIQSVLTTLIIILTMISTYGFLQYATDQQVHTSKQVFQKQFGKQAKIIMSYHIKSVQYTLYRSKQQIEKTNALYHLMQQIQYPIIEQPYSCLNNLSLIDEYAYSASFCYEIYADTKPSIKIQYLKNLCSFLTEMFLMIDGDYDLMFASTGDLHFFSVWPGSFLGTEYNPQIRIWYTNHLDQLSKNKDQEIFFSPPHIHYTWKLLMIAQTLSMTDLSGQLDGVIASHVNLSQFKQSSEDIAFSIIYPDGRILLSQYNITENSYIYDTNLTHLNYNDYVQIMNSANKQSTNSTCDTGLWDDFGYLCLKVNNSDDQSELFNAYTIEQAGLILVIQIKLSQFHIQLENMFLEFQQIIQSLFFGSFIGFLSYMITSVVVSSIVIMLLFNPLIRIINYTSQEIFKENFSKQYILKQKTKFKFNKIQSQEATTMENLQQSFNKMIHSISNKSELCFLLEHFIYPRKRWRMKKRTKKINNNNLKLINNEYEIGDKLTNYEIRFIQSILRQNNHLE